MNIAREIFPHASFLTFLFGACVGSFLNVCIYRIPRDESVISPRSHCPQCNHLIAWYDNVPVLSFFLLRRKCRYCQIPISPRYVIVEIITAIVFIFIGSKYALSFQTPIYWMVAFGLILGAFIDLEHMIIPDRVTWGGILIGLVCSIFVPELHGVQNRLDGLKASAIGAGLGFGMLWGVACLGRFVFKRDAMGFGDVKLIAAIGAFMGWEAVLFTIMISSFVGSGVGLCLIAWGGKRFQSKIPYGPYLSFAAIVWILWGCEWWQSYMNWLIVQSL
ncbi:MAG: prepilin peptidase [Kiritimatiellae bacterium]|nr:prepilin peptidase [Kiritimatiellia bacterium]